MIDHARLPHFFFVMTFIITKFEQAIDKHKNVTDTVLANKNFLKTKTQKFDVKKLSYS